MDDPMTDPIPEPTRPDAPLVLPLRAWRLAFFVSLVTVLVLSLLPTGPEVLTTGWDKTNHLVAFAVLALLGCWSFPGRARATLPALLAYGGLIELLQSLTAYRFAEWADLLADGIGIVLGWLAVWLLARWPGPGRQAASLAPARED